jgi:hypothetical protein
MAEQPASKPASPFAGLDTSLLRSTRPASEAPAPEASSAPTVSSDSAPRTPQRGARRSSSRPISQSTSRDTTANATEHEVFLDDSLEFVRRAVRTLGKEAATYRFTQEEKRALSSIVYAYKERGVKTSENEITRIALNYLIDEYRRNDTSSILAQVLSRLNR